MGGVFRASLAGSLLGLFGGVASAWAAPVAPSGVGSRYVPPPLRRSVTLSATWLASNEKPAASGPAKSAVGGMGRATGVTVGPAPAPVLAPATVIGRSSPASPARPPDSSALPHGSPVLWSKGGPARLVWTGFKERDGNAEVLLQVTRGREPKVLQEGGRLRLIVPSCRLRRGLAGKPLDTRFFPGSVDAVAAHQRGRNVEVDVRLRQPVSALAPQRRQGPHGSSLWVVAVPAPGSAPVGPGAAPGSAPGGSSGPELTAQASPARSLEKSKAQLHPSAPSGASASLAAFAPSSRRTGLSHR